MAPANQLIIVWDFDRTIITGDCDRWVVLEMGLTKLFTQLRTEMCWNSLMDRMMEELHSQGKTVDDLIKRLNSFSVHPEMISAIRWAHDFGYTSVNLMLVFIEINYDLTGVRFRCDLKVLSNANKLFIETILKNHGVYDCFSEIITNPTVVHRDGRLRIFPYHGLNHPPHGCQFCPPNLCKGSVIGKIQESKRRSIIYIGDGRDDLCAVLKLKEGDHIMPRFNMSLYHLVTKARIPIIPKIHPWKDAQQINNIFMTHLLIKPQPQPGDDDDDVVS